MHICIVDCRENKANEDIFFLDEMCFSSLKIGFNP